MTTVLSLIYACALGRCNFTIGRFLDALGRYRKIDTVMNYFATTNWTAVLDAAQFAGAKSNDALAGLCKSYWYPLYALSRSLGDDHSDAQDLTQAFFEHLIERQGIAAVHPSQGRFRSFLIACFKNFRSVHLRKWRTQKRGGEFTFTSFDALNAAERFASEPADNATPESRYDRNWAIAVLDRAYVRLEGEYAAAGKQVMFARLHSSIEGANQLHGYDVIAADLSKTKAAIKMEASRMRQRFSKLLRDVVSETVDRPADVEDELRYLLRLLSD